MSAKAFIDTNILIYSFALAEPRAIAAREIIAKGGVISVQVLNEFVNVSRRKAKVSWPIIAERVAYLKAMLGTALSISEQTHDMGRRLAERYKIAFYDALLVAAAHAGKCNTLLTEDMQHGAVIEGVTIRNPFRHD